MCTRVGVAKLHSYETSLYISNFETFLFIFMRLSSLFSTSRAVPRDDLRIGRARCFGAFSVALCFRPRPRPAEARRERGAQITAAFRGWHSDCIDVCAAIIVVVINEARAFCWGFCTRRTHTALYAFKNRRLAWCPKYIGKAPPSVDCSGIKKSRLDVQGLDAPFLASFLWVVGEVRKRKHGKSRRKSTAQSKAALF